MVDTYGQIVARVLSVSVDAAMAPDVRRLAREEHVNLLAVMRNKPRLRYSDAGYRNVYGLHEGPIRMQEDKETNDMEHRRRVGAAIRQAEHFLALWGLN